MEVLMETATRTDVKRGFGADWTCPECGLRLAFRGHGITRPNVIAMLSVLRRRRPDHDGIARYGVDRGAHRERQAVPVKYTSRGVEGVSRLLIYCPTPSCSDRLLLLEL
jgi:hypothetical protein